MAEEQYVNRDQHRTDMAQLHGELKEEIAGLRHEMVMTRGELKEEIAGVRQDVAVLTKTVEHLASQLFRAVLRASHRQTPESSS